MTGLQQKTALVPIVVAYRLLDRQMGTDRQDQPSANDDYLSFRAALRLDDKRLDHAIAYGAHKQPWQSEVAK
jgi:hypothetical protein